MRSILLAAVAVFASTADAVASPACSGPWVPTYRSPPACPLILVERNAVATPPSVEVWRNGELVTDATAAIVTTPIYLDVDYYATSCDGFSSELEYVTSEPFVHHSIEVNNTQPGDEVVINGAWVSSTALIEAPGPCYVTDLPRPECYATQTANCEDEDTEQDIELSGCSTSHGGAGLPLVLAIAACLRRRRRRNGKTPGH
jgi:hypothetical protein